MPWWALVLVVYSHLPIRRKASFRISEKEPGDSLVDMALPLLVETTSKPMLPTCPGQNRSSMIVDNIIPEGPNDFSDLDQMLQSVRL